MLEKITLLKRNDNQQQGTVTSYILFQCRISPTLNRTGQTIQGSMLVGDRAMWYIPRVELKRVGVNYLNDLDRIVDKQGRVWCPTALTYLEAHTFENHIFVWCERLQ